MRRKNVPERTVERLAVYRGALRRLLGAGAKSIYSHELASMTNNTPARVRRDLMVLGQTGANPRRGYQVEDLENRIRNFLSKGAPSNIALVGVGNLGRAVLSYFTGSGSRLSIQAAFDTDSDKTGRVIAGCRCHPMEEFEKRCEQFDIELGIITVPAAAAQDVADRMAGTKIRGILNFAPVPIQTPPDVFAERIDITATLEKIAFFSKPD